MPTNTNDDFARTLKVNGIKLIHVTSVQAQNWFDEYKAVHRSLAGKSKEEMTDFEKEYQW